MCVCATTGMFGLERMLCVCANMFSFVCKLHARSINRTCSTRPARARDAAGAAGSTVGGSMAPKWKHLRSDADLGDVEDDAEKGPAKVEDDAEKGAKEARDASEADDSEDDLVGPAPGNPAGQHPRNRTYDDAFQPADPVHSGQHAGPDADALPDTLKRLRSDGAKEARDEAVYVEDSHDDLVGPAPSNPAGQHPRNRTYPVHSGQHAGPDADTVPDTLMEMYCLGHPDRWTNPEEARLPGLHAAPFLNQCGMPL